jgi:hypothetical protein
MKTLLLFFVFPALLKSLIYALAGLVIFTCFIIYNGAMVNYNLLKKNINPLDKMKVKLSTKINIFLIKFLETVWGKVYFSILGTMVVGILAIVIPIPDILTDFFPLSWACVIWGVFIACIIVFLYALWVIVSPLFEKYKSL